MSMNEDRFAGTGKNVGGRVEQGFGRATGDVKTGVEGKFKQATGAAQDAYGQAKDAAGEAYGQAKDAVGDTARSVQEHAAPLEEFLRNAIESRPYTSVAVALGLGWFKRPRRTSLTCHPSPPRYFRQRPSSPNSPNVRRYGR